MRLYHYDAYTSPCMNCREGAARQLEDFVPEPGFGPNCWQCGDDICGKDSHTGLCRVCASRKQTNRGNRSKREGVKAYWGYKEIAHKIATKKGKAA